MLVTEEETSKRKMAGNLVSILPCDYIVTFTFPSSFENENREKLNGILEILQRAFASLTSSNRSVIVKCMETWKDDKVVDVGFRIQDDDDNGGGEGEIPRNNVILGPLAEMKDSAKEFRDLWGPKECQLRRFLDGTIRESVEVENSSGSTYLIPSVIRHLRSIHFADVRVTTDGFDLSDFIPRHYLGNLNQSPLYQIRRVYDDFVKLLTTSETETSSNSSLPSIRKVRCSSSLLHYGGDLNLYRTPIATKKNKKVKACEFQSKDDERVPSSLIRSIPVIVDITNKKKLDDELFEKLRFAYLIDIHTRLVRKRGLSSVIKDKRVIVEFRGFLWRIDVADPRFESEYLTEFLYGLSLRHSAWSATAYAVRRWLSAKCLDGVIPETASDLILAEIFMKPSPPKTVEAALIRFFDFLSFTDFDKYPLVLNNENCVIDEEIVTQFRSKFEQSRKSFPPLCVLTRFESGRTSRYTEDIRRVDLRRLVNLARQTLSTMINQRGVKVSNFVTHCNVALSDKGVYDIVVSFKSEQIPPPPPPPSSRNYKEDESKQPIPIVDFHPLLSYVEEIRESYGDVARFYYSKTGTPSFIGIKLDLHHRNLQRPKPWGKMRKTESELVPNIRAMIDDLRILGTGFVTDVVCNIDL